MYHHVSVLLVSLTVIERGQHHAELGNKSWHDALYTVWIDMWIDMWRCTKKCTDRHLNVCVEMGIGMYIDMFIDLFMDMYVPQQSHGRIGGRRIR